MKKNLFLMLTVALFSASTLFAQEDTMRTLVKFSSPKYVGIYFAPEYQYGQAAGTFNSYTGGSAMFIFNKKLAVGVTALRSVQESFAPAKTSPLLLRSGFGGVKLEYTPRPNAAVHVTFPLVIGYGMARLDSVSYTSTAWTKDTIEGNGHGKRGNYGFGRNNRGISNDYFVLQPGIQLETNLFRTVKLFGGVNYRFAFPTETLTAPLTKTTLNGLSANVGIKVGLFDFSTTKERNWKFWKKKNS
jgi:hypothetical protein